jgi:hypothetical protein
LTAITAKLLHGIGTYRIPHEHLFIYFVFTNELTQEEYDALEDRYIECATHGTSRMAFICQHLVKGSDLGFHESLESNPLIEPDDDYWAWCSDCEKICKQQGEWNHVVKKAADMKIVCDQCYFEIKRKNK